MCALSLNDNLTNVFICYNYSSHAAPLIHLLASIAIIFECTYNV